jgi:sulfur carrier protein ThiS
MDLAKGSDREELLMALGLDPAAGILVVVNGTVASKGRRLSDRDRVSLFAPVIGG